MNKAWWKEAVVYQIYPRSFCDTNGDGIGDLQGVISKLDYLKRLGITVIWLSPIFQSPNYDNGYDISDYRAIMEEFGTMEDFDLLLAEAGRRDIKIVLDFVVNHTSHLHPWFQESRKSKDSPYRDYYIWQDVPNNWEAIFGGSAWEYDEAAEAYYLHLFTKEQPDLNWENPRVRDEMYDMMRWWLDKGVSGFRLDAVNLISKPEGLPDGKPIPGSAFGEIWELVAHGPKMHDYMHEVYREVCSKYDVFNVGEMSHTTVEEALLYCDASREELSMLFHFEHMMVDHVDGSKWGDGTLDLVALKEIMSRWQTALHGKGWNGLYWCNHDQPRIVSRFGDDGIYRVESAKMLGACLHMMQGTPYIYQGEELGMTNASFTHIDDFDDIEIKNAFAEHTERGVSEEDMLRYINKMGRDNARTPMQWSAEEHAGFTTGKPWLKLNPNYTQINAAAQVDDPRSVFNFYRELIALRKRLPVVVYGDYQLLLPEDPQIFAYTRSLEEQKLLVICNFSESDAGFDIPADIGVEHTELLLANYPDCSLDQHITLRPHEARIYLHTE